MRHYSTTPQETATYETARKDVASATPLGLGVFALATTLLGCYYAGFIIPFEQAGARAAVGALFLACGIVLLLAGMWEFRRDVLLNATIFTSYGGFLLALGLIFTPNLGILGILASNRVLLLTVGVLFLCWTIFTAILTLGAVRENFFLLPSMGLLCLAFLLLTIGQLALGNRALLIVGGWLAIVCALVTWVATAMSITGTTHLQEAFRQPPERRVAVE